MVDDDLWMFTVAGPIDVPLMEEAYPQRHVSPDEGRRFFADSKELMDLKGCYVFCMRSGGGLTPWYVGKTTSSFGEECFASHKLEKYNQALAIGGKGTPVLLFVVYPQGRGPVSKWVIDEVEAFLIETAYYRNEKLLNKTKRGKKNWGISGVVRSPGTHPTKAAKSLTKSLWL